MNNNTSNGFAELVMADYARKMCEQSHSNARHQAQVDTYYGKEYDPPEKDCAEDMNILVNNGVITDEETLKSFAQPTKVEESPPSEEPEPAQVKQKRQWPLYLALALLGLLGAGGIWSVLNAISNISQQQSSYSWDFMPNSTPNEVQE